MMPTPGSIADAGVMPLLTTSELTGRAVFNSGVMSLPAALLGKDRYADALEVLPEMESVTCSVLRDFADQKFWNVYLSGFDVTYLSTSLNANKQLLDRYLAGPARRRRDRALHRSQTVVHVRQRELVSEEDRHRSIHDHAEYPYTFARWNETYRRLVGARRRSSFRATMGDHLDGLRDSRAGRGAVLLGNGPSLQRTNLGAVSDRVRIGFNWFVNHDRFDEVQVDHLMVMSHMFFGGWHTVDPAFPPGYLDALTGHGHRPTLWFPFYFEPLIAATPELQGFDVRYLLLEKPFKQFAEQLGYLRTNLTDFLSDARTGVLTAGLPARDASGL